jgi:hypothetical protein
MSNQDPWFFEVRAEAFVSLVLTKCNDVKILPYAGHDMGIDLLIDVLKNGKSSKRFFGAQLVPYMDLPSIHSADERVLGHTRNALRSDSFEAELPICAFVIGVRKPEGIYRWSVEPVVEDGQAVLRPCPVSRRDVEKSWQTLDDAGAARLIGQVNAWYDARNGGSAPRTRGQHSKMES